MAKSEGWTPEDEQPAEDKLLRKAGELLDRALTEGVGPALGFPVPPVDLAAAKLEAGRNLRFAMLHRAAVDLYRAGVYPEAHAVNVAVELERLVRLEVYGPQPQEGKHA